MLGRQARRICGWLCFADRCCQHDQGRAPGVWGSLRGALALLARGGWKRVQLTRRRHKHEDCKEIQPRAYHEVCPAGWTVGHGSTNLEDTSTIFCVATFKAFDCLPLWEIPLVSAMFPWHLWCRWASLRVFLARSQLRCHATAAYTGSCSRTAKMEGASVADKQQHAPDAS